MSNENESTNRMADLLGYTEMTVTLRGESTTTHEVVRVRALPVRLLPEYLAKIDDEAACVELFCDKPKGWADSLTPSSHEAILAEGERMNSQSFFDWLRRRIERQERIAPGTTGEMGAKLASHLRSLSPKSASAQASA